MMIDKRLIRTVRESKKYIAWNVIYQWISLVANIPICFPGYLRILQTGKTLSVL